MTQITILSYLSGAFHMLLPASLAAPSTVAGLGYALGAAGGAGLTVWWLRKKRRWFPPAAVENRVRERTSELEDYSRELKLLNLRLADEMKISREAEAARRQLEQKVQESQRLESLGVMAGGIAHDFNNLLAGIMGNAELALQEIANDRTAEDHLQAILGGSERAADLCRQMLAYAGKAPFFTSEFELSDAVASLTGLLRTSIGSGIEMHLDLDPDRTALGADRSQIEQALMNLVMNSAEAIADQGQIRIRTGRSHLTENFLPSHPHSSELAAGSYVFLEVTDTGKGMSESLQDKIFEPFFSTKFLGRGLGLPAVFGIVRRHRGAISVESEPDQGTKITVFFPTMTSAETAMVAHMEKQLSLIEPENAGTILIVDDEEMVRTLAAKALENAGFSAIVAGDGSEGVSTLKDLGDKVACVLLDMSMPKMDGEAALKEMRQIAPDIPIIIMSGYSEKQMTDRFIGTDVAFLPKPFALDQLRGTVRSAIQERLEDA